MQQQVHHNKIRQLLFIGILIVLIYAIGKEMYFLLGAFLGAITVYILLLTSMNKLTQKYKWKKWIAAIFLMLLSFIAIVLPCTWLVMVAIKQLSPVIKNPEIINSSFHTIHDYLLSTFNLDIFNETNIEKLNAQIMPVVQKSIGSTLSSLGNLFMMYIILFFMLIGTDDIELWLKNNVPFNRNNVNKVINNFRSLVYSNAVGIPIVAGLQGLVGCIGYWIFGVHEFILMGILTAIFSVMPVVGSMAIYVPLALYQLAVGETWKGIYLLLWGLLLVGTVDNIARFMIQKRIANVHPLITILGVIIGVNMFGFLGIIFGPLLLSMVILLVQVYIDEYGATSKTETWNE